MSIVIAIAMLAATVVFYRALFLGARIPRIPWWAADSWVEYLFGPVMLSTLTLGAGFLIEAFVVGDARQLAATHAGALVIILAAAFGAWRLLGRWARNRAGDTTAERAGTVSAFSAGDAASANDPRGAAGPNSPSPPKAA